MRRNLPLVACAVSVLGVSTAGWQWSGTGEDTAATIEQGAAVDIIDLRWRYSTAIHDELIELLLANTGQGDPTAIAAATQAREAAVAAAVEELTVLASGDGSTAEEAQTVLDAVRRTSDDPDADDLYWLQRNLEQEHRPPDESLPADLVALHEVAMLADAGRSIVNDGLQAEFVQLDTDPAPGVEHFVAAAAEYLSDYGGWLGDDPERPLTGSFFLGEEPADHPSIDRIDALVRDSGLVPYDAWVRSWRGVGDPGVAPPLSGAEAVDVSRTLTAAITEEVEAAVGAERAAARSAISSAQRSERLWLAATVIGVVAMLTSIAVTTVSMRRRIRARETTLTTDALTGTFTRHALGTVVTLRLEDRRFAQHTFVAIDTDRFKLVNDSWGHQAGDHLLRELARRVQSVLADVLAEHNGAQGAVVRLGGDEFLLAIHTTQPFDASSLVARLDEVRSASLAVPGDESARMALSFSIGLAVADRTSSVDDLMHTADLAMYEEKAARRSPRASSASLESVLER
jgi:diguanylate cyclase (GGDEF)-like protein